MRTTFFREQLIARLLLRCHRSHHPFPTPSRLVRRPLSSSSSKPATSRSSPSKPLATTSRISPQSSPRTSSQQAPSPQQPSPAAYPPPGQPPLFSTLLRLLRFLPPPLRWPLHTFLVLLTWLPVIWFVQTHVFCIMRVTGPSMYPFLNADYNRSAKGMDWVGVWMWGAGAEEEGKGNGIRKIKRGSVVVFRSPMHPEKLAIKRVVAVEGDTVLATRAPYPVPAQDISVGHVWVEGEHPEHSRWSYDSNTYGPVSRSLILGTVVGVVWPWSRRSRISAEGWRGSDRVREREVNEAMHVAL